MAMILSTGTAVTIATTTGDAGQLGMVVGFDRFMDLVSQRMSRLIGLLGEIAWGNARGGDLRPGDTWPGADRLGSRDRLRWLGLSLGWLGCLIGGLSRRHLRPFSQHFVSQG